MLRFWLPPVLALSILFALFISAVNARPYDNPDLRTFLQATHTCEIPCWEGIQPGMTSVSEIQLALEHHEWVREVTFMPTTDPDSGFITWTWNHPPASVIDSTRQGEAGIADGVVIWVQIPTAVGFGDVWLTMGPPPLGRTIAVRRPTYLVRHYAAYDEVSVQLRYTIPCAWSPGDLWQTQVSLWLGVPQSVVQLPDYVPPPRRGCQAS